MPIVDDRYVAPTWHNLSSPAINAAELQAMSDSIERVDQGGGIDGFLFYAGDGFDPSGTGPVTHTNGYVYLDTGSTLNFTLGNYMMEIDLFGYGKVGAVSLEVLEVNIYTAQGNQYTLSIKNGVAVETIDNTPYHCASIKAVFLNCIIRKNDYIVGDDFASDSSTIGESGYNEKTVNRITITGKGSNNVLMNAILRFRKIK